MRRTQVYLTEAETEILDREALKSGRTRSQLIREAIEARFNVRRNASEIEAALSASAGAWSGKRLSGEAFVEQRRTGRLSRIHEL